MYIYKFGKMYLNYRLLQDIKNGIPTVKYMWQGNILAHFGYSQTTIVANTLIFLSVINMKCYIDNSLALQ